jgi:hypothetical protein
MKTYLLDKVIPLLPAYPHLDRLVHQPRGHYHPMELPECLQRRIGRLGRWLRHRVWCVVVIRVSRTRRGRFCRIRGCSRVLTREKASDSFGSSSRSSIAGCNFRGDRGRRGGLAEPSRGSESGRPKIWLLLGFPGFELKVDPCKRLPR